MVAVDLTEDHLLKRTFEMQTESCKDWTELAYDPAAQARLAEAARNDAMDSIFAMLARSLKSRLGAKSRVEPQY